ncbi:hypothetical protein L228DRAFT_248456 [Xylona heveae TC161]|uniref:Protein kinase domain-containing protein n=1 Tax=Xylona heveae (strain CBS 132557 / TC161) TaxID=1328760 RepID=A0A165G4F6_XYLHT|nr:hypothetical protein L228DRAFT_248456 [Xylona heveae TC161]KZF21726.1 hypothetical protein L228DRAFT_248456 [Xylona heveae TC161]
MSRNYGFYGKRSKSSSYLSSTFQSLSPAKAGKQRLLPEINEIESAISRLNICEETKPKSRTPSISSHGARDDQKDERKLSIEGNSKSRGKKSKRNQKDGRSKEVEDKPIEKKTDIEIRNDSENVTSASSPKREERSPHKALREKSRNIQSPVLKRQGKTEEKIPKASTQSRTNRQSTHHHASPSPPSLPAPARQTRTRRANALDKDSHTASKRIAHAEPLLKLCNDPEGRNAPTNFQAWADEVDRYFDVDKIAEASYGEVYRLKFRDADSVWTRSDESVLKIIALKPPPGTPKRKYKIDLMSAIQDVASEVDLLRRMSTVPGFTNFREVRVMCGRLPSQFVEAWKRFKKAKSKSEFPDPGKAYSYPDDQLWAVIEMQDAGTDLENITLTDVYQLWDVFWGVAMTLAKGEELAGFEVRLSSGSPKFS